MTTALPRPLSCCACGSLSVAAVILQPGRYPVCDQHLADELLAAAALLAPGQQLIMQRTTR